MHDDPRIVELIRTAADRHGCPRRWALAFAWCESGLRPNAEGDTSWHVRHGGELYARNVLHSVRLRDNPARTEPTCWHSYGLFQLLACFHVQRTEHPRVLLDPTINADRGCRAIARLYKRTKDVRSARLAYVGCGYGGELCDERRVTKVVDALTVALNRYATEPDVPMGGGDHA